MKKKLLITGGFGYIGSHTLSLIGNQDYEVHVIDNLINSNEDVIFRLKTIGIDQFYFHHIDLLDFHSVQKFFNNNKIDFIIHYASLKSVSDSIINPENYYRNNIVATLNLIKNINHHPVKFIFSSSATVYGNQTSPVDESMDLMPLNPYAYSKVMIEQILSDFANSNSFFNLVILRYFNPVGAHPSGLLGENPKGTPNNLMPYINKVALGHTKFLPIYGNDYDTNDGTCLRDFIHVLDLAKVHLLILQYDLTSNVTILNVGTGFPTSVLDLVTIYSKVNNIEIPFKFMHRRKGDIDVSFANCTKLNQTIDWKPAYSIRDMCIHAWKYSNENR